MSKVFVCDICGKIIKNKYAARMVEFRLGPGFLSGEITIRKKVHLCEDCYDDLINITEKRRRQKNE